MSASSPIIDHPSSPLTSSTRDPQSPQTRSSLETFPEFSSSPIVKSSPVSQHTRTHSSNHLDIPGANTQQPQRPNRPFRSASQRLPPTALLSAGRNESRTDLNPPATERDDQPQQRLPRAMPAPSLSGPFIRPTSSIAPGYARQSVAANLGRLSQPNAEELKSESLWADMQRTLADVELSAMNSSHLFNAPHYQVLEKLRETQLALAHAWARSEADETAGQEDEDDTIDSELDGGMSAASLAFRNDPTKTAKGKGGKDAGAKAGDAKNRKGSGSSNIGRDLEEETERDIKLARKRREANDHYFSQVNRGVLDVVARLDEVAAAMRIVEKESRAVWEEMGDAATAASATDVDGDTDGSERGDANITRKLTRVTTTTGTGTGSGTELSDSPVEPKRGYEKSGRVDRTTGAKHVGNTKEMGR